MTWLVTGGAGYIGAHVVRAFEAAGMPAVVVDNLSSGHASFVRPQTPLLEVSILDTDALAAAMEEHSVTGVVHLAAFKYAGESVNRPLHTYTENITGTIHLLCDCAPGQAQGVSILARRVDTESAQLHHWGGKPVQWG